MACAAGQEAGLLGSQLGRTLSLRASQGGDGASGQCVLTNPAGFLASTSMQLPLIKGCLSFPLLPLPILL